MRTRRATVDDAPALAALVADAFDPRFGEGWTGAQLVGTLAMPISWAEVAESDARIEGFSLARVAADEAELLLIAVRTEGRRRGLGRKLLRNVMRNAAGRGAARLMLEVRHNNEGALALYRAFGFEIIGRRYSYYTGAEGDRYDAITMARALV